MGVKGIGDVFCDHICVANTNPYRFVTKSLTLQRLKILVADQNIKVGRQGYIEYPVTTTTKTLILHNIDLADLWFQNDVASANVYLIGTTKD